MKTEILTSVPEPSKNAEARADITNMPIADQLRWLCKNRKASDGSFVMRITPQIAEAMLALNTRNRPKSRKTAARYADMMKAGEWAQTGLPLIFAKNGLLVDGQHRLYAVVLAKTAVPFHTVWGVDPAVFSKIDIGKVRSAGDIFSIEGETYWDNKASLTRLIWTRDIGRAISLQGTVSGRGMEHHQLYAYYHEHVDPDRALAAVRYAGSLKNMPRAHIAYLYYTLSEVDEEDTVKFLDMVLKGINLNTTRSAPYRAREIVLAQAQRPRPYPSAAVLIYVIRAWVAWRAKKRTFSKGIEDYTLPQSV